MLIKIRPFTSATSTARRIFPARMIATACSTSIGRLNAFAKWFNVPAGMTPSATSEPAMTDATPLSVPSPPAATIVGNVRLDRVLRGKDWITGLEYVDKLTVSGQHLRQFARLHGCTGVWIYNQADPDVRSGVSL